MPVGLSVSWGWKPAFSLFLCCTETTKRGIQRLVWGRCRPGGRSVSSRDRDPRGPIPSPDLWLVHRWRLPYGGAETRTPIPTASRRAGLDVGRDRDPSVLAILQGNHILPLIEFEPEGDLTITLAKVEAVLYENEFRPRGAGLTSNGQIVIDCSGLGAPVYDMMKARGWNVVQFLGGSTAWDSALFDNTRAEAMFATKRRVEDGEVALPDDAMLIEECIAIRWYTTPLGSRKRMERKEILRARLGRSNDRLDAASMVLWEPRGPRRITGRGALVAL